MRLPRLTKIEWVVAITIVALLAAMLGQVALDAINYTDTGTITSKKYKSAWTEMRSVNTGNHFQSIPIHHPQRWTIRIMKGEKYATFNVSESMFNQLKVGDEFDATAMGVSRE